MLRMRVLRAKPRQPKRVDLSDAAIEALFSQRKAELRRRNRAA
jgi:hypothetical protein